MGGTHVIGLDIGTTAVRAAEIQFGKGGAASGSGTLLRLGQVPLPHGAVRDGEVTEPATVAQAIRQLWSSYGFSSKEVVLGVGNQRVVVRDLELPWMPLSQLKASLPYQVQELLPVAAGDALLDFCPTGEVEGAHGRMVQGLLVAAQRDTVVANVLAVESAGLKPTMVDLNAFALVRALSRGEMAGRTIGFVDVGARVTTVVIAQAGVPQLVRILAAGGQNITEAVAAAMSVSAPEAENAKRAVGVGFAAQPGQEVAAEAVANVARNLVEAVRNTIVYYSGHRQGQQVEYLVLTGGGAYLPGFGQYLSSSTRVPVALGDPLAGLRTGKSVDRSRLQGSESLLAMPVGLASGMAA